MGVPDNNLKLHQKQVVEAWSEYGIRVHPGAGKRYWDRKKNGFSVDYPELMPLDRSVHHKWKNSKKGGLYALWDSRPDNRRTTGGFRNDVRNSWASIPQLVYQNAIEGCRKVCQTCHENNGIVLM